MASKKYSKIYMLDIKANKKDQEVIEALINNLMSIVKLVSKTAKISRNDMERPED